MAQTGRLLVGAGGALLILLIFQDAFETVVLPRRVTRSFRFARFFYRYSWSPVHMIGKRIKASKSREAFLSFFGPMSLLLLLGIWAVGLIFGFALMQYGAGSQVVVASGKATFHSLLYLSGSTFFTLGIGDAGTPNSPVSRLLAIIEAGTGFGFLGIIIGYLPVMYGNFSQREINITLLDSRAGTPPSASELLVRFSPCKNNQSVIGEFFAEWERWSAELLESHLSYPVLSFFRSQHDNQSWLAALTVVLDSSALLIVGIEGLNGHQAKLTFAMARHAVADLAQIVQAAPEPLAQDRLPQEDYARMSALLAQKGLVMNSAPGACRKLSDLRGMYEPYVNALSERFLMPLPPWIHSGRVLDNWKTSAWGRINNADAADELQPEHF